MQNQDRPCAECVRGDDDRRLSCLCSARCTSERNAMARVLERSIVRSASIEPPKYG